jgi:hypothetical protein
VVEKKINLLKFCLHLNFFHIKHNYILPDTNILVLISLILFLQTPGGFTISAKAKETGMMVHDCNPGYGRG